MPNYRDQTEQLESKLRKYRVIVVVLLVVGVLSHVVFGIFFDENSDHTISDDRTTSRYNLLNPGLVEIDYYNMMNGLEKELEEEIREETNIGGIDKIGVYFRDMESGYTIGVNENEGFIPASLLKLPTAIAHYKRHEDYPGHLDSSVVNDFEFDAYQLQETRPEQILMKGETYSIRELIKRSLVYSDNVANSLLIKHIDSSELMEVFDELSISMPKDQVDASASPRNYSNIFKILYNSSYLSRENSQEILAYLVDADFNLGIKKGLPENIVFANKFGERFFREDEKQKAQIHDCGIVYVNHPYILCVMTSGTNKDDIKRVLEDVSRKIYQGAAI